MRHQSLTLLICISMLWSALSATSPAQAASTPASLIQPAAVAPTDSQAASLTPFNGMLVFTEGAQLWRTDGTAAGTQLINDFCSQPLLCHTSISSLIVSGNLLFFVVHRSLGLGSIASLARSDGTPAGTVEISVLQSGRTSALGSIDGTIFLVAGSDLWRSDGVSLSLITHVDDLGADLLVAGRKLVLVTGDRKRLWMSDGTAVGTRLFYDQRAKPDLAIGSMVALGERVVFSTQEGASFFWQDTLWISDGSAAGTVRLKDSCSCSIGDLVSLVSPTQGSLVLFSANAWQRYSPYGPRSLWRTDGTLAGTFQLTDRNAPGIGSGVAVMGGQLFFTAHNSSYGDSGLWASDGTVAGTRLLRPLSGSGNGSTNSQMVVVAGRLFFATTDIDESAGLWVSDGTEPGTRFVSSVTPASAAQALGNLLIFVGGPPDEPRALWRSDGTTTGTTLLRRTLTTEPAASGIGPMVGFGTRLLFSFFTPEHGAELWVSDGGPGDAHMVADLCPGGCSARPRFFQVAGDKLFFVANDTPSSAWLWVSDGSAAGTHKLKTINVRQVQGRTRELEALAVRAGRLFFLLRGAAGSFQLWTSDGTVAGTTLVRTVSGQDRVGIELVVAGDTLFFTLFDALWRSDGTAQGTQPLTSIAAYDLYPLGDRLLFVGDGNHLWVSDGTVQGTAKLQSIRVISPIVTTDQLGFFVSDDQLWRTDGTVAGTQLLASNPSLNYWRSLARAGSQVVLSTCSDSRTQLWQSDGTSDGTGPLTTLGASLIDGQCIQAFDEPSLVSLGELALVLIKQQDQITSLWAVNGTAADSQRLLEVDDAQLALGGQPFSLTATTTFIAFTAGIQRQVGLWAIPRLPDGEVRPSLAGSAPGGVLALPLAAGSAGLAATGGRLQVTLPAGVSYLRDTAGSAPTISGQTLTWELPKLAPLEHRRFTLYARAPQAAIGSLLSFSQIWLPAGADADAHNNSAAGTILIGRQTLLPRVGAR